ncbi:hypothetical protein D1007_35689 [Hordeum vulgare]|nr:hypothetical protein D1007_35689 [Hordeum vulgare]
MQNATEKLGPFLAKHPELQAEFNDCVNDNYAPEEFEARWIAMVQQHGVAEHPDFVYLFQGEMESLLSYSYKQTGAQEYMVDCIAKFVPAYDNKSFKVHANVEEGVYMCECCKYERDGIICCHILRIMVQLGVTTLPAAYILKRWTWLAEEMLVDTSSQVPGKVHEMPEESVILMKTTLMKNEFALLAKVGCRTADGRKIIGTHLKEMKRELAALAKEQKKENQGLILLQLLQRLLRVHHLRQTMVLNMPILPKFMAPTTKLILPMELLSSQTLRAKVL